MTVFLLCFVEYYVTTKNNKIWFWQKSKRIFQSSKQSQPPAKRVAWGSALSASCLPLGRITHRACQLHNVSRLPLKGLHFCLILPAYPWTGLHILLLTSVRTLCLLAVGSVKVGWRLFAGVKTTFFLRVFQLSWPSKKSSTHISPNATTRHLPNATHTRTNASRLKICLQKILRSCQNHLDSWPFSVIFHLCSCVSVNFKKRIR